MTTCAHRSPPGTMHRLPLWAQGDVGKAEEAAALAGAPEVSPQSPKFCIRHPSQAVVGTRGVCKCSGQVATTVA